MTSAPTSYDHGMPRQSLGERKAFTLRLPLDVVEQLADTSNESLVGLIKRGLVLHLTDDDLLDLTHLAEAVGFLDVPSMLRVICAREWHRLQELRDEAAEQIRTERIETDPGDPERVAEHFQTAEAEDEGGGQPSTEQIESAEAVEEIELQVEPEPPAMPFSIEELRRPLPPRVRVWVPDRPEYNGTEPPRRPLPPRR
jgi:hypothetical protein